MPEPQATGRSLRWLPTISGSIVLLAIALVGCTSYRARPLDQTAVDAALTPPVWPALQLQVAELHHPRLTALAIDPAGPFTPQQLALVAVVTNPGLRVRRTERSLAEAQVLSAGILPNPTLAVGADLAVSSPDGGETPGSSVGIGWDFTGLITRGAKRAAAQAHAEQVALDIAWEEWLIAETTAQAAFQVAAAEQRLVLTQALEQQLTAQHGLLAAGLAAGASTRLDVTSAYAAMADCRRLVAEHASTCRTRHQQLNRLLGLPPTQVINVQVPAWPTTLTVPPDLADSMMQQRLDLIALRRGYDSQEEALRAAVLGQFPRISFELVHATDTGKVRTLTVGASIDLPVFDRNQGAIASETATRERLFAEYGERLFTARADLAEAIATAAGLSERIALTDQVVTTLEQHAAELHRAQLQQVIAAPTAAAAAIEVLQRRLDALELREQLADTRLVIEVTSGALLSDAAARHGSEHDQLHQRAAITKEQP